MWQLTIDSIQFEWYEISQTLSKKEYQTSFTQETEKVATVERFYNTHFETNCMTCKKVAYMKRWQLRQVCTIIISSELATINFETSDDGWSNTWQKRKSKTEKSPKRNGKQIP